MAINIASLEEFIQWDMTNTEDENDLGYLSEPDQVTYKEIDQWLADNWHWIKSIATVSIHAVRRGSNDFYIRIMNRYVWYVYMDDPAYNEVLKFYNGTNS